MILCFKVGDNVGNVSCSGVTLTRVQNPTQISFISPTKFQPNSKTSSVIRAYGWFWLSVITVKLFSHPSTKSSLLWHSLRWLTTKKKCLFWLKIQSHWFYSIIDWRNGWRVYEELPPGAGLVVILVFVDRHDYGNAQGCNGTYGQPDSCWTTWNHFKWPRNKWDVAL